MVVLALVDDKGHDDLGKEGVLLAKVGACIESEGPGRLGFDFGEDVFQRIGGHVACLVGTAVRQPRLDAAVVVGLRLEGLEGRMSSLELHADALGRLSYRRVEHVAGDGVLLARHYHEMTKLSLRALFRTATSSDACDRKEILVVVADAALFLLLLLVPLILFLLDDRGLGVRS